MMTLRHCIGIGFAMVLSGLAACDKRAPQSPPKPSTAASNVGAESNRTVALPGVLPHSESLPPSSARGPADASTAIGGMSGNQEAGGADKTGKPAPTGGDGTPSAASAAPK